MSIRIRLGCALFANVRPASASVALSTVCPAASSRKIASVMLAGLSSTISTVAISGDQGTPRHRAANFSRKAVTVELRFFHDGHHKAIQFRAIGGADLFSGDHEDRNASRGGIFVKRLDHIEA